MLVGCLTTVNTHAAGKQPPPQGGFLLFTLAPRLGELHAERLKVRAPLCNLQYRIISVGFLHYAVNNSSLV